MNKTQKIIVISASAVGFTALVVGCILIFGKKNKSTKTSGMKTLSNKGLNLIKEFEGKRLTTYQDSVGVWTIGYGHTAGVHQGDTITEAQATEYLKSDVKTFEDAVNSHNLTINQNQFDALVSFTFNLGAGNLAKSTLLKKVKANADDSTIRDEFLRWNKAGNMVLAGLTRRRQAEADLYFN